MDTLIVSNPLARFERITIKIGSALLVDPASGEVRLDWLQSLISDIAGLHQSGVEIVVVSSGAVSLGRHILGLEGKTLPLDQIQAAASVGQIALSQAWFNALAEHDVTAGQILLTPNITEERRHFINARATVSTLLALKSIPIINENDSVATSEIRYGDNDRLSARVAAMIGADCLVLLSDVDGLYTAPPGSDQNANHIPVVRAISADIIAMAGGAASHLARGGMTTKLEAAKIATQSGTAMIIAKGDVPHPLKALSEGARHTLFSATQSPAAARKRWILATLKVGGTVRIDVGAAKALLAGKSLLPIGVTHVSGEFSRGDAISILDAQNREIARGLAGMNYEEANLAKGKKSHVIIGMFGAENRTELVHADNLALVGAQESV